MKIGSVPAPAQAASDDVIVESITTRTRLAPLRPVRSEDGVGSTEEVRVGSLEDLGGIRTGSTRVFIALFAAPPALSVGLIRQLPIPLTLPTVTVVASQALLSFESCRGRTSFKTST